MIYKDVILNHEYIWLGSRSAPILDFLGQPTKNIGELTFGDIFSVVEISYPQEQFLYRLKISTEKLSVGFLSFWKHEPLPVKLMLHYNPVVTKYYNG